MESQTQKPPRNSVITFRVSEEEKHRIDQEAMRLTNEFRKHSASGEITMTDVIQSALNQYFKSREPA